MCVREAEIYLIKPHIYADKQRKYSLKKCRERIEIWTLVNETEASERR